MVEKFKELLNKIKAERGEETITLFAIAKMDDLTDRWVVILCAPWATGQEAFEYVRKIIVEGLSQEELSSVARISVSNRDESLIKGLLQYQTGSSITDDTKINGNIVHEAHILESNPN